jgi:hypothetical protein
MSRLRFAALAVLLLACAASGQTYRILLKIEKVEDAPPPPEKPLPKPDPRAALGRLTVGTSGCTVTVIGPRRADGRWDLLTASHCIPGRMTKGSVKMPDGRMLAVTVTVREPGSDLAWLVTDEKVESLPYANLAAKAPEPGVAIWHAGYGVDRPGNVEEGVVLAGESRDRQLSMDLSVSSGDSGGGIFRKDTAQLVAVVCCTRAIGRRATMFGGSSVRAIELRPTGKPEPAAGGGGPCQHPLLDLTRFGWDGKEKK